MAVAYEYTEEMMNQLNAIRGDKTAFRKLRREFRKQLGIHSNVSSKDVKVTSEGKPLKEKKYDGTTLEQVSKDEVVGITVESNQADDDSEEKKALEVTEKTYTTDEGDTITIVAG